MRLDERDLVKVMIDHIHQANREWRERVEHFAHEIAALTHSGETSNELAKHKLLQVNFLQILCDCELWNTQAEFSPTPSTLMPPSAVSTSTPRWLVRASIT
jgi:hypothetical protein